MYEIKLENFHYYYLASIIPINLNLTSLIYYICKFATTLLSPLHARSDSTVQRGRPMQTVAYHVR